MALESLAGLNEPEPEDRADDLLPMLREIAWFFFQKNTIHSEIFSKAGWGRKTGGKCCVPGKIKESDLRRGGLRWWIPPRYGPSSTGSICDMLLLNDDSEDLASAIGDLSYLSQGNSAEFSMLTSNIES